MPDQPAFITTVYGERYAPFLLTHLHSIATHHPDAPGIVLWQDLPRREVDLLSAAHPNWRFLEYTQPLDGELHQRIPRKLHAWHEACSAFHGRPLCFLDCDTVLLRPLDPYLSPAESATGTPAWDITFTWKDELFPINTGVLLARDSNVAAGLLEDLCTRVERIVRSRDALQTALGSSGAADQHALREIIGFCNYDREIVRTVKGREMVFRGVPCRRLNETNCRAITEDLSIIHYKTGWHPILLDGAPFTEHRPADRCRQMFEYFRNQQRAAHRELARAISMRAAAAAANRFAQIAGGYEERGILNSEMLAVCGICENLGIDVIIETGRARGQSTRVLARYFENSPVRIASIEMTRDDDAIFAEKELATFAHVELLYGDAFRVLPSLLEGLQDQRIAILMDGLKGLPAIELMDRCFASPAVVAGFIHDTRRATPQRDALEESFRRVFFTDSDPYVSAFRSLDDTCLPHADDPITIHTWRPWMKGEETIQSYGPTLAILFPDVATSTAGAPRATAS